MERHSAYSNPGPYASLVAAVDPDIVTIAQTVTNLVGHYRAESEGLDQGTAGEIHLRGVAEILEADQSRHPLPLSEPRPPHSRVHGCCRDHALLAVSILRSHGVAARTRVGFAGYFIPGWWADHVVAELWDGERWLRFDPEFVDPSPDFSPHDLTAPDQRLFRTAAEAWLGWRSGELELTDHGVAPDLPELTGPPIVRDYVVFEAAHLCGDELLLWDLWGGLLPDGELDDAVVDELAHLLVEGRDADLERLYRSDDRLHPTCTVLRLDPLGGEPVEEPLAAGG